MTKIEKSLDTPDVREHVGLNFQNAISKSDWEAHRPYSQATSNNLPRELTFDNTIYGAAASLAINSRVW